MANTGKITAVIGPVVDVSFEKNELPEILNVNLKFLILLEIVSKCIF